MSVKMCQLSIVALVVLCNQGVRAQTVGQWDFDGDLEPTTTAQSALQVLSYPDVEGAPGVNFTTADIGGETAQVAELTAGTAFAVGHGAAPNGGGGFVNDYTIILDALFPVVDRWTSLYQTDTTLPISDGSDGDWFVNPSNGLGISGNYGGTVVANTWHRLVLVVDSASGNFTSYLDGAEVQQNAGSIELDGRFSLFDEFFLFADESGGAGEMGAVTINSLQVRAEALSGEAIAALGGASAAGIPLTDVAPCDAVFFADNFNGYASDAAATAAGWQIVDANAPLEDATWTMTNPGGRSNPGGLDGGPSSGNFMVSDSDAAGGSNTTGSGMSHDLISPSFATVGATSVWLHADVTLALNDNGEAVFDVDVSVDGGATWTHAFRRVAPARSQAPLPDNTNADGYLGQLDVDLSAAAGEADVQVRFRHFEPNDDWWVAIDNVRVDCEAPPSGGECEVLPAQDFSGGLGAMVVNSVAGNVGTETWHTSDKGGRYASGTVGLQSVNRLNHPGADPDFAIVDSDANPDPAEDEFLITPVFNLATFSEVFLHYKSEILPDGDQTAEVVASIDGGATFPIRIFRYTEAGGASNAGFAGGNDPYYADRVFSVPQVAGEANVVFAFHYQSGGNRWWWAIDDVKVTGTTEVCDPRECGLRNFAVAYDAGTNTVSGTWASLPGDSGFQVLEGERVVADLGAEATSFEDTTPPAGGSATYTLRQFVGGEFDRDCVSGEVQTFACTPDLTCRADQVAKSVELNWTPAVNIAETGYEISANGVVVDTVAAGVGTYVHTPDLSGPPGSAAPFYDFTYTVTPVGSDACASVSCRAILSPGSVCFADDFDDYADDVALELGNYFIVDENSPVEDASWSVLSSRSNPPTFDGQPSSGGFVISDSDAAGGENPTGSGMSHDLWTPSFATTGKDVVWLHADVSAQMNNNGVSVFDIDVSTDEGVSWQNVYRTVAPSRTVAPVADTTNADGFWGQLHVDLSSVGNLPSVKMRFRHFEPNDDWWIAVDNIIIDDVAPLSGGATTVYGEDFSSGDLGTMSAVSLADPANTGTETWHTSDKGSRDVVTFNGGTLPYQDGRGAHRLTATFAIVDSDTDPDPAEDEWLLIPALDLSDLTEVFLHWDSETVVSGSIQDVLVSLDGGTTFEAPIFSYTTGALLDGGEEPFYAQRVMKVPAAAGQSDVVFAFHWVGQDNWWWAIDNVSVTGNGDDTGASFVRGDCDGDTEVCSGVNDALVLLNWAFLGQGVPPCLSACDVNGSGEIEGVTDAVANLNFCFIGSAAPPEPYPDCGPGNAADVLLTCETPPAGCE